MSTTGGGFRLGRLAGFPLTVHASVLVIAALLTWTLAVGSLPDTSPGHSTVSYWMAGAVAAACFFASLLAHELSHAIVARRAGLEVRGLTVWLFGGIAFLEGEPTTPTDDLRIALAGPITSLALGAGFLVVAGGLAVAGVGGLGVAVAAWLGVINLILGAFNLLPGAPLDGGRVLRGWLWRRTGDRREAARRAARAGRSLAHVLIGVGVIEVLLGGGVGGVWLVLIGTFVLGAARAEEVSTLGQGLLSEARAGDVMTADPKVVPASASVEQVIHDYVLARPHSSYPVVDRDGRVVGLITLDQLRAVPRESRAKTPASSVMIPRSRVPSVASRDPLLAAIAQMGGDHSRALVFEGDRLAGIITAVDVAKTIEAHELAGS